MPGGVRETKDEVVEVAVLLLERRLKTELLFPVSGRWRRSDEDMSPYEDASDD